MSSNNIRLPRKWLFRVFNNEQRNLFWNYYNAYVKWNSIRYRLSFLQTCSTHGLVPRFLSFKIPNNGAFTHHRVIQFQLRILRDEIVKCIESLRQHASKLAACRAIVSKSFNDEELLLLFSCIRCLASTVGDAVRCSHNKKISSLRIMFDKPAFGASNGVTNISGISLPTYVTELLKFGPKHPILTKFNKMGFLTEVEKILPRVGSSTANATIAASAIQYANSPSNKICNAKVKKVRDYLQHNSLVAVPFDKGLGFCVMTADQYSNKALDIISLPQFRKFIPHGSQKQETVIALEEKFNRQLRTCLKVVNNNFIGPLQRDTVRWNVYNGLRATGSRLAPLYGLAKVHKPDIPLRPIISFPGSTYHNLANHMASLVSDLPESQINCCATNISQEINKLSGDKFHVSYDFESLFTNVPLMESINMTVDLLVNHFGDAMVYTPETLRKLLIMCSKDCVFQFDNEVFVQCDGVAMGSPLGPLLANIFMSHIDKCILSTNVPRFYRRYVDDTICVVHSEREATSLLKLMNNIS